MVFLLLFTGGGRSENGKKRQRPMRVRKPSTTDLALASYELDMETGARYNYCEYGFRGVCMIDGESHCLLKKCYHDMERPELAAFRHFWHSSAQWLNTNGKERVESV